jgi:hypothetical protein
MTSVSTAMRFFTNGRCEQCKRLFIIEVVKEDTIAPTDNVGDPMISLHALIGIQPSAGRTIQIIIVVNGAHLVALLNSGSTHNFIDEQATTRAGIDLEATGHLRVAVANGDRLSSLGCCRVMHIMVHSEQFYIDCYGLTLGSNDMV